MVVPSRTPGPTRAGPATCRCSRTSRAPRSSTSRPRGTSRRSTAHAAGLRAAGRRGRSRRAGRRCGCSLAGSLGPGSTTAQDRAGSPGRNTFTIGHEPYVLGPKSCGFLPIDDPLFEPGAGRLAPRPPGNAAPDVRGRAASLGLVTFPHVQLAANPHDRTGVRRSDDAWLDERWADPRSRVLVISGTRVRPVGGRLEWLSTADAPDGLRVLLGEHGGTIWFAVVVDPADAPGEKAEWLGLRALLPHLAGDGVDEAPLVFH